MPKNFVPFDKLSKRAKKDLMSKKRVTWGSFNPITRRTDDKKKYNRKKIRFRNPLDNDMSLFYL